MSQRSSDSLHTQGKAAGLLKHLAGRRAASSCNLALAGETKAAISRLMVVRGGDGCMVLSCRAGYSRPVDRGGPDVQAVKRHSFASLARESWDPIRCS